MKRASVWIWRSGLASALLISAVSWHALAQPPGAPGGVRVDEGMQDEVLTKAAFGEPLDDGAPDMLFALGSEGFPEELLGPPGGPGLRQLGPGAFPGAPRAIQRSGLIAELKLTDSQRKRIGEILARQIRQAIQARAALQVARLDLRKLLREESPDRRAIEGQI